jgi:hypothetical protein
VAPFLTLFTRHMLSRPQMYERLLESIAAQTDQDFEHVVTVDETGQGFAWANRQFSAQQHRVNGDYVLQCDDDLVLEPDTVAQLKAAARATDPDIIVYRVDHCQLGILPDDTVWRKQFVYSHIGGEDMAIRRDVWADHLYAYNCDAYEGDWRFMSALAQGNPAIYWLDKCLIRCQRISHGKGEAMTPKTGDAIKLTVETASKNCRVEINGEVMPGVRGFLLDADVSDVTTLTIKALWPYPPTIDPVIGRSAVGEFTGFFVGSDDMRDFVAWRKAWGEQ